MSVLELLQYFTTFFACSDHFFFSFLDLSDTSASGTIVSTLDKDDSDRTSLTTIQASSSFDISFPTVEEKDEHIASSEMSAASEGLSTYEGKKC